MTQELFDIIIPSIAFFIAFFLSFLILQVGLTYLIRRFFFKKPEFQKRHAVLLRWTQLFMLIFAAWLLWYSRLIEILAISPAEVKIYSLEILLAVVFVYLTTTREAIKSTIARQAQRSVHLFISFIVFVLATVVTSFTYEGYREFINATIVHPVSDNVTYYLESRQRKKLLTEFRAQYLAGECKTTDLNNNGPGHYDLVFITTDPGLNRDNSPIIPTRSADYLEGSLCDNGAHEFFLTDHGQWYWLFEE